MNSSKLLATLSLVFAFSYQMTGQVNAISYHSYENGQFNESGTVTIESDDQITYLSKDDALIRTFLDYDQRQVCKIINYNDSLFRVNTPFDSLTRPAITEKKDTILGYPCNHVNYNYFSNSVDVYFTREAGLQGSPYSNFIPENGALVLRVVINGNRELIAHKIDKLDRESSRPFPYENASPITQPKYEELRIKSRFTSLNVFKDQIINFDPSIEKPDWDEKADEVLRLSNGTIVLKKVKLPESAKKGSYTFINLKCRSNGDAYDRTGSVFAILPGEELSMLRALKDSIEVTPSFSDKSGRNYHGFRKENNFTPALELMRFFTSFGVDHFNDKRVINNYPWKKTATFEQDITKVIPDDQDEIWIGVFIGNYSKGGHIIDLDLEFYPSFEEENGPKKWIQPVFNTVNIMEMSGQEYPRLFKTDTLTVDILIPENIEDLYLLYTSTGHGGWGEGDEFNPKLNEIFLDGELLYKVVPWRTDCAKFRLYNPASGNFSNGMSSSDFSRSNWCPATSTPPYFIPLDKITPGEHTLKVAIDQGDDAGNSFNAWSVSGVLVGTIKP